MTDRFCLFLDSFLECQQCVDQLFVLDAQVTKPLSCFFIVAGQFRVGHDLFYVCDGYDATIRPKKLVRQRRTFYETASVRQRDESGYKYKTLKFFLVSHHRG